MLFGGRARVEELTKSLAATSADDQTLLRVVKELLGPIDISTVNKFLLPTLGRSCEDLETQLAVVSSALLSFLVDSDSHLLVRGLKFLNYFRLNHWSGGLLDPKSEMATRRAVLVPRNCLSAAR